MSFLLKFNKEVNKMIVYNKTKREFLKDVEDNCIDEIIESYFLNTLRHKTGKAEKRS